MKELTPEDRNVLEQMIDRTSLAAVLDALALTCAEKAEHVRCNWQDDRLAKTWDRAVTKLLATQQSSWIQDAGK